MLQLVWTACSVKNVKGSFSRLMLDIWFVTISYSCAFCTVQTAEACNSFFLILGRSLQQPQSCVMGSPDGPCASLPGSDVQKLQQYSNSLRNLDHSIYLIIVRLDNTGGESGTRAHDDKRQLFREL